MFKPHTNVINAPLEIQEELVKIRHQRAFIPSRYLEIKARLINQYFNQNNLSHVVIGISGGIDSVTCLYLFLIYLRNLCYKIYLNNETHPTCLCYSLCLAYKRMKLYDNTIVIIEKQFQPIENKVEAILRKYLSIAFKNKVSTIPEWIFI